MLLDYGTIEMLLWVTLLTVLSIIALVNTHIR